MSSNSFIFALRMLIDKYGGQREVQRSCGHLEELSDRPNRGTEGSHEKVWTDQEVCYSGR